MQLLGLVLAAFIGFSLGLLGGGGSILAVPILVYVVGMGVKPAISVSLLVVGTSSLIGSVGHWRAGAVDVRIALVFGVVSMAGSYAGGRLATRVTDGFQLTLFAVVMLAAAISMFGSGSGEAAARRQSLLRIAAPALGVGLLTGVVGVGGGFLIVPALVIFASQPMKRAVGTSLLVIAMNSASGFAAYAGEVPIDWGYTATFAAMAATGVLIGSAITRYLSAPQLRRGFALFLAAVAAFVLIQNGLASGTAGGQRRHAAVCPRPGRRGSRA